MQIGRYAIYEAIASGGMACVHFGRFAGPAGFARTVAVKRMLAHLVNEPEFVAMFVDEARLAARIRHPNVVSTLDVLAAPDELLIVMEYVHGEPLAELMRVLSTRKARIPVPIACAVVADLLAGLHAAHEAVDAEGRSLGIVHRDVSPENVLVGADGSARVLDFGVAKAVGRLQVTREGQIKGKIPYMSPEQVRGLALGRATDIYSASAVLWEMLAGRRLFDSGRDADLVDKILFGTIDAPAAVAPTVPEQLNAIVLRGLARDPADRFPTAREMVSALRQALRPASTSEVSDWVESIAGDTLARRAATLRAIDRGHSSSQPEPVSDDRLAVVIPTAVSAAATTALRGPADMGRRWGARRAGILGIFMAALCGFGLLVARSTGAPPEGVSAAARSSADTTARRAAPTASEGAASAAISESAHPAWSPVLAASIPPSATHVASSNGVGEPALPAPKRTSRPFSPKRSPDRVECVPPFSTDADGTRHYKLKCL
jgi:serine/threonine protein kinase